jgi:glutamyl-tRNA reductase
MKSILSVLVLGLGATGAFAANFLGSCDANSVKVSGRTLTANCKNIFGQLKCSKLDLNRCLKNNYGRLQEDPSGAG